jgi:hypothetical protein
VSQAHQARQDIRAIVDSAELVIQADQAQADIVDIVDFQDSVDNKAQAVYQDIVAIADKMACQVIAERKVKVDFQDIVAHKDQAGYQDIQEVTELTEQAE